MQGETYVSLDTQFGDTGKRKFNTKVFPDINVNVRVNGGNNSGGKFKQNGIEGTVHSVPLPTNDQCDSYIGGGCVIPESIIEEIDHLEQAGLKIKNRLYISPRATLIQPHHQLLDQLNGQNIGTTGRGIGPAYASIAERMKEDILKHISLADFVANPTACEETAFDSLIEVIDFNDSEFYYRDSSATEMITKWAKAMQQIGEYMVSDPLFIQKKVDAGSKVLLAVVNGALLDPKKGTAPYCTSSTIDIPSAYRGADLHFANHKKTIGIAKIIMTRVGNGPFVSEFGGAESETYCDTRNGYIYTKDVEKELYDPQKLLKSEHPLDLGKGIRMLSNEYGATTGRPRRIGELDLFSLKHVCAENKVDELYLSKADEVRLFSQTNLSGWPVTIGYKIGEKVLDHMPVSTFELKQCEKITVYLPHCPQDISAIRDYGNLPGAWKENICTIEDYVGVKIHGLGLGPDAIDYCPVP